MHYTIKPMKPPFFCTPHLTKEPTWQKFKTFKNHCSFCTVKNSSVALSEGLLLNKKVFWGPWNQNIVQAFEINYVAQWKNDKFWDSILKWKILGHIAVFDWDKITQHDSVWLNLTQYDLVWLSMIQLISAQFNTYQLDSDKLNLTYLIDSVLLNSAQSYSTQFNFSQFDSVLLDLTQVYST